MRAAVIEPARRISQVTGAFMWLGITESIAYPLVLILQTFLSPISVPIIYLFVSKLVDSGADVGNDYYTFVIIGFTTTTALAGGLGAFSHAVDSAIQQGRFETFLVQPISWYTLPFALAAWPIVLRVATGGAVLGIGLILGARIDASGLPAALLLLALGVACTHAIGILAASVRLLSKKADPVVTIYTLASSILSGAMFPVELLPPGVRLLAYLLPHTYVIAAIRRILMPEGDAVSGPSMGVSIVVLVAGAVVLYTVCLRIFGRSLDFGRRYGVLGGY